MPVSSNQVSFDDAKKWSQRLKKSLLPQHPTLRLNECQEALAKMLGFPHWHAFTAQASANDPLPTSPATTSRASIWSSSEDRHQQLSFRLRREEFLKSLDLPLPIQELLMHWREDLAALSVERPLVSHSASDPLSVQAHRWGARTQTVHRLGAFSFYEAMRQLQNTHVTNGPERPPAGYLTETNSIENKAYHYVLKGNCDEKHLLRLTTVATPHKVTYHFQFYPADTLRQFQQPHTFEALGFDEARSNQVSTLQRWTALPHGLTLVLSPPDQGVAFTLAAVGAQALQQHGDLFPQVQVVSTSPVLHGLKHLGAHLSETCTLASRPQLLIIEDIAHEADMSRALAYAAQGGRVWAGVRTSPSTIKPRLEQLGITPNNQEGIHGLIYQQRVAMHDPVADVTGKFIGSQLVASIEKRRSEYNNLTLAVADHLHHWKHLVWDGAFQKKLSPETLRALEDSWAD